MDANLFDSVISTNTNAFLNVGRVNVGGKVMINNTKVPNRGNSFDGRLDAVSLDPVSDLMVANGNKHSGVVNGNYVLTNAMQATLSQLLEPSRQRQCRRPGFPVPRPITGYRFPAIRNLSI